MSGTLLISPYHIYMFGVDISATKTVQMDLMYLCVGVLLHSMTAAQIFVGLCVYHRGVLKDASSL
jgi:hypothetical protein